MTTTATLAGLSDRTLEQALEQNFSDGTLASAVGIVAEQFSDAVERSMLEEAATRLAQVPALLARVRELTEALEAIERWDMPETGKFWENADGSMSDRPLPYGAQWGSRGEQQHIRQLASNALNKETRNVQ